MHTLRTLFGRVAPRYVATAAAATFVATTSTPAMCMMTGGTANPFTPANLMNGNALLMPTVDPAAATIVTAHNMDMFLRHMATLEHVTHMNVQVLSDLGLSRGYHLAQSPAQILTYAQDIIWLDGVPGHTDPGPQAVLPNGAGTMQPQALTHGIRGIINDALVQLAAAALPPPPLGHPPPLP